MSFLRFTCFLLLFLFFFLFFTVCAMTGFYENVIDFCFEYVPLEINRIKCLTNWFSFVSDIHFSSILLLDYSFLIKLNFTLFGKVWFNKRSLHAAYKFSDTHTFDMYRNIWINNIQNKQILTRVYRALRHSETWISYRTKPNANASTKYKSFLLVYITYKISCAGHLSGNVEPLGKIVILLNTSP